MQELTEKITVSDSSGNEHTVLVFTNFTERKSGGVVSYVPGTAKLQMGERLLNISKDEETITDAKTGEVFQVLSWDKV